MNAIKKSSSLQRLLLILGFLFIGNMVFAHVADTAWTKRKANKWFKKKEWAGGLKLSAYAGLDKVAFARQYHKNKSAWDKAFAYLRDQKLEDIAPGKYPIDGEEVFASVTDGPNKTIENASWESHRKYIDLQYVIKGQETITVAPAASATIIKAYDESRDVQNYTTEGKGYLAKPDVFFLFFPSDAHRPNIKVPGYDTVKKLVIKIRVQE